MKMEQAWNNKYAGGTGALIWKLDISEWYRYFPVPALVLELKPFVLSLDSPVVWLYF
jgi:hypothetical protein